jgi:ADP-ribosylglycohydrolase
MPTSWAVSLRDGPNLGARDPMVRPKRLVVREVASPYWADAAGRDPVVSSALAPASYDALDTGGFAPDVLRAAVHFVGEADTFDDALAASIAFAGPSNYCPVLAGSIGGARWGASSVDPELYAHHPAHLLQRIESVVSALSPAA